MDQNVLFISREELRIYHIDKALSSKSTNSKELIFFLNFLFDYIFSLVLLNTLSLNMKSPWNSYQLIFG